MAYRVHTGQLTAQETRFRDDLVIAWDLFEFEDADCEALRRRILAGALIARAATHLKAGEGRQAEAAAARARALTPKLSARAGSATTEWSPIRHGPSTVALDAIQAPSPMTTSRPSRGIAKRRNAPNWR